MMSSWQTETGHLVCRWSAAGQRVPYHPSWMQDAKDLQGRYLPSLLPDFTGRSPFGGASWYQPHRADRANTPDSN